MFLIANSGTHPEPMHLACGLIESGTDVVYATSASWARDSPAQRLARLRILRHSWFARNLRRRELPTRIRHRNVTRAGLWREIWFQTLVLLGSERSRAALQSRLNRFEAEVATLARSNSFEAVFCQYASARKIFEAVGDQAFKMLGYPTAHHGWTATVLAEEARRNPEWAPFLQRDDFPPEYVERLNREIALADVILVPSSFVRRTFESQGVTPAKLLVAPLAPSTPPSRLAFKEYPAVVGVPSRPLRVLFAGQVTQRKGISYVLEAIASVEFSELTIVGPPLDGVLRKIGKPPRVIIMPSQPKDELISLMERADVLIFPSLADGFGLVAIEAMSCGTPCILSEFSFGTDVISDGVNGVLVDPQDPVGLANALRSFIDSPAKLRSMGEAARSSSAAYNWEAFEGRVSRFLIDATAKNHSETSRRSSR